MGLTPTAVTAMRVKHGPDYFARLGSKGAEATKQRHGEDYYERQGNACLEQNGIEYYRQLGRKSAEMRRLSREGR